MKLIDLFEEHEKELVGGVLQYSLCTATGRWFVGALEVVYESLVERIRELESKPTKATFAELLGNEAADVPGGPQAVLPAERPLPAKASVIETSNDEPAEPRTPAPSPTPKELRQTNRKPRVDEIDPSDPRVQKAAELIRKGGMTHFDVMRVAQVNAPMYAAAKRLVAAEAKVEPPESEPEPESECTKLPFVVESPVKESVPTEPDEPFVAPPGFDQPLKVSHGHHPSKDDGSLHAKPRTVAEIGYQRRILCLRAFLENKGIDGAMRDSALNKFEAAGVSDAFQYELRAEILRHEEAGLSRERAINAALQSLLVRWQAQGPDPEAKPGRRSA